MTDNIKLPLVATSDHPEFPVLAWSPLELAEINRLMREAVRLNAQAVLDGWKLVPVDPTDEMVKVGDQKTWVFPSRECWTAMLSAAPAAPQPAQPLTDDPCPGCQVGTVCRTPKCGRLKLPVDHPLRTGVKND